jgi:hypothetical protein
LIFAESFASSAMKVFQLFFLEGAEKLGELRFVLGQAAGSLCLPQVGWARCAPRAFISGIRFANNQTLSH